LGFRVSNLRQAFNIREGLNPLDYIVSGRLEGRPPLEAGPLAGSDSIIRTGQDKLAGHYTFNVNGRFLVDEYDVTVQPSDRILVVVLAMGG
jgi:hypothetical protein